MVLVTQAEIEQYSGFKYTDFTENGLEMTTSQWAALITALVPKVTQVMQRYCNVVSFEPLSVTEYHNGRGSTNYDSAATDYNEEDRTFFLRQLYVNNGSLLVYEDMGAKTGVPVWTLRSERPNSALAEVDTLVVTGVPTSNGNITITLNGVTSYTIAVTTTMTIPQICAAIVAAGAHTDSTGVVWTPGGLSPYVTFTAGTTGAMTETAFSAGTTGTAATMYITTLGMAAAGGDYDVYCENDVTRLIFNQNVPNAGSGNVKFIYDSGYALSSQELNDVKFQALRAMTNILLTKKKIQEANTIRNYGVRDYSQMFDAFSESVVLDDKVKAGLEQYRRAVIPGTWTYE